MLISASELTASPGKSGQLRPLVAQMRDTLTQASGRDWYAWAIVTGRPFGSFMLSTRFDSYADMLGAQMQVALSAEWATLAAKADGVLANPAPTMLDEVIAVTGEPTAPKQFVLVTRAVIDRSAMMDAIAWSTQVAEHVTKVTGVGATVSTSAAGTMFQVTWVTGVDTPEELDKMNAINTDAGLSRDARCRWCEPAVRAGNERARALGQAALSGIAQAARRPERSGSGNRGACARLPPPCRSTTLSTVPVVRRRPRAGRAHRQRKWAGGRRRPLRARRGRGDVPRRGRLVPVPPAPCRCASTQPAAVRRPSRRTATLR